MKGRKCDACGETLESNQWHDENCRLRTYKYSDALVDDVKELGGMGFSCLTTFIPVLIVFGLVAFLLMS